LARTSTFSGAAVLSTRAPTRVQARRMRAVTPRAEDTEVVKSEPTDVSFVAPEPKRFYVRPDQYASIAGAALPFAMRLGTGAMTHGYGLGLAKNDEALYSVFRTGDQMLVESSKIAELKRPAEPLIIYEFEGCPFCKKVREAVCILDIDVLFKPCPMDGPTFRPEAVAEGGKKMFPYMKDPNTDTAMYESDEIIAYMFNTYGDGEVPLPLRLGPITAISAGLGMLGRMGKGSKYRAAKMPEKPLELWAYDISPFCKVVRETMVELELPHVFHSTARGSPKRQELFEKTGTFQVPYLEDPNTGVKMFESAEINEYLEKTYAL